MEGNERTRKWSRALPAGKFAAAEKVTAGADASDWPGMGDPVGDHESTAGPPLPSATALCPSCCGCGCECESVATGV